MNFSQFDQNLMTWHLAWSTVEERCLVFSVSGFLYCVLLKKIIFLLYQLVFIHLFFPFLLFSFLALFVLLFASFFACVRSFCIRHSALEFACIFWSVCKWVCACLSFPFFFDHVRNWSSFSVLLLRFLLEMTWEPMFRSLCVLACQCF